MKKAGLQIVEPVAEIICSLACVHIFYDSRETLWACHQEDILEDELWVGWASGSIFQGNFWNMWTG